MSRRIFDTALQFSAFCSLLGLLYSIKADWYKTAEISYWLFLAFSFVIFVVLVWNVWSAPQKTIEYKKRANAKWRDKVRDYMGHLMQSNGKTVIVSNDLSWVDPLMLGVMKGKGSDLTVFVATVTQNVQDLKGAGVIVYNYSSLLGKPLDSRFTIVNIGSLQEETSVGYGDGECHRIDRCSRGSPEHHLAVDLVHILQKCAHPI